MSRMVESIEKGFLVPTSNLLFLPRRKKRVPLLVGLHGMGMGAEEFADTLSPLRELPLGMLVPEGPYPYEIRTAGQHRIGRAWYLYTGKDEVFVKSMQTSGRHLRAVIGKVIDRHPVDPDRVVLLGFSQGGYFAGYWGIKDASRFRGLVVNGARIKDEVLPRELRRARNLSVLLLHGLRDRAVPHRMATESLKALTDAGIESELKSYDCGHHVNSEQLCDIRSWLEKLLF